jgi:ABC transport system ATP-binding/permease protein
VRGALGAVRGVCLTVSPDRYFLNRVCTDILAFEGEGRVIHSVGDYDYYTEKRARAKRFAPREPAGTPPRAKPVPPAREPSTKPGRPRKFTWKETRELEGMEASILAAEEAVARIEALFAQPDFHRGYGPRTNELKAELEAGKARVAQLYARWQELEAIRGAAPQ